ncbi:sulfite exporter TauE/SafE family protein [Allostreptomyces psammosilenae]|uniref:Probable membrane transporter protein n=1 Tax=Allostreptomyces psammosilenae TaxID=1892865 RepID=A0A852ZUP6_9ACTN|nr:sulfite exporter TauE/SafE family protein [Allostreptomyces psammosilenae]NYI04494.1 hypothetical protein [Allostreptomyces psammosilenae]
MSGLGAAEIAILVVAALLVGFAKTAIGGVGAISVALFAAVLPARESTGALLPLLLVGDVLAVRAYRRHVDWPALLRLFPSVAVGVLFGVAFVAVVDDTVMRRTIGGMLLVIVAVHLWQRRRSRVAGGELADAEPHRPPPAVTFGFGLLAGFTTMVANAGGAVMSVYLLSAGFNVLGFLGTGAWFFLIVNLFKVPFSAALGLITVESLARAALLAVFVLIGAAVGRASVRRLDRTVFERLVLVFTVLSSLNLLR